MYKKRWIVIAAGWMVGMNLESVYAGDATRPWKNDLEASLTSANGNSKTTAMSLKNAFAYDWAKTSLEVLAGGIGGSDKDGVTDERYFASEKISYKLTEKNYVYEKAGWDKDRFSGIRNRLTGTAGVGRWLLDLPKDKLKQEFGAGAISEDRIGSQRKNFATGRAFLQYTHTFTKTARFTQEIEYLHDFMDATDYRVSSESAFITHVAEHVSLKTSFGWNRINQPVPGDVKDDTRLMAGLVINY